MTLTSLYHEVALALPPSSSMEGSFSYQKINYDQVNGIGNVPNNQEISYKGFVCLMTPAQFLNLALPLPMRSLPSDHPLIQALQDDKAIASPFFSIDFDKEAGKSYIFQHEGRHRMLAIRQVYGASTEVVVHMFVRGRAYSITKEDIGYARTHISPEYNHNYSEPGPHFNPHVWFNKEWIIV